MEGDGMHTFQELIDRLYEEQLREVELLYADAALYDRFAVYMKERYEKFVPTFSETPGKLERFLTEWYQTELRFWGDYPKEQKYARFTKDEKLIRLDELSNRVYFIAVQKLERKSLPHESKEECLRCIAEMESLPGQVMPQNLQTAETLYSEALVEADYVCNNSQNISFRMARRKRYMK